MNGMTMKNTVIFRLKKYAPDKLTILIDIDKNLKRLQITPKTAWILIVYSGRRYLDVWRISKIKFMRSTAVGPVGFIEKSDCDYYRIDKNLIEELLKYGG